MDDADIYEKLNLIESRLENIESIVEDKLTPLMELLQLVVKTSLNNKTNEMNEMTKETEITEHNTPIELMYKEIDGRVYISGTKTYNNRDLIKSTFKGASWDKEKSAWSFNKFENYEKTLFDVFPTIIKNQ